jgi:hypothetical protein
MELSTLEQEVQNAISIAEQILVTDNDEEAYAVEFGKIIKKCQKLVSEEFDPGVEDSHSLWKRLVAQRAKYQDPLKESEKLVKDKIKFYRLNLEKDRLEQEEKAKAASEMALKLEKDRLMEEAEESMKNGDAVRATELAVKAATMENGGVFVESKTVKQEGMSIKKTWKAKVIDVSQVPRQFLVIDQKSLDAYAREKGVSANIPGVEFYEDSTISLRS